jgi:hypothetical protein
MISARRILGIIVMIAAVLGVAISIVGIAVGHKTMDRVGDRLDAGLATAIGTFDNLEQTLQLSRDIVDQVVASMATLEQTALDASEAINAMRPMVTGAADLVTGDVADALESVQQTVARLVDLATTIDETLTAVSEFTIEEEILGVPIKIDPGIEYDPDGALSPAMASIADSLVGIPEKLRALSGDAEAADENLELISQDLALIAGDVKEMRGGLAELPSLIDGFQDNVASARDQIQSIKTDLRDSWKFIKTGMVVFFVWLGLTQIAPFLWGLEMVRVPRSEGPTDGSQGTVVEDIATSENATEGTES